MNNINSSDLSVTKLIEKSLEKRNQKERYFRIYGLSSLVIAVVFLLTFFASIISTGYQAFIKTDIELEVFLDSEVIYPNGTKTAEDLFFVDYDSLIFTSLKEQLPELKNRNERRQARLILSSGASYQIQNKIIKDKSLVGQTVSFILPLDDEVDMYLKGYVDTESSENSRKITDFQIALVENLNKKGLIHKNFNTTLFVSGDSREPELAGILGALVGSFMMLSITFIISFPLAVSAAIYLEEFAKKNMWTDFLEVNINNLAAVPSIIYGLLGLAIFINFFGFPRSAPIVGGLVLSLMTFPVVIIASRAALKSVPPSIRDAALGLGASKIQTTLHHVVPLALPGMLTGSIVGMARALGESAPLIMIGMVAFVVDIPTSITEPSAALPVQVFLWSDAPERGFAEKTSAAIMVLLVFLLLMNSLAIWLRNKFQIKW